MIFPQDKKKNKTMTNPKKIKTRQGDLLFEPMTPNSWQQSILHPERADSGFRKDGIIQEGEATGHHHILEDVTKAQVFRPRFGSPIVVVGAEGARVIHAGNFSYIGHDKPHGPVDLLPNTIYQVKIAREEDPTGQIRQVID